MEKIKVDILLEILGRPAEHIKEGLNTLVVKLGSEKGMKIISKKYHEPVIAEGSKDLYTSFAEVSLELDSVTNLFALLMTYMPAHLEVISPEKFSFTNADLNELANQIVLRLHNYDAIAKNMLFERDLLVKKLMEVAPHLFKQPPAADAPASPAPKAVENKIKDNLESQLFGSKNSSTEKKEEPKNNKSKNKKKK